MGRVPHVRQSVHGPKKMGAAPSIALTEPISETSRDETRYTRAEGIGGRTRRCGADDAFDTDSIDSDDRSGSIADRNTDAAGNGSADLSDAAGHRQAAGFNAGPWIAWTGVGNLPLAVEGASCRQDRV